MKIGLLTAGRWHLEPYLFLKKKKFDIVIFDDDKRCFLAKKFGLNSFNLKSASSKKFKDLFFWSPVSDVGSALADQLNNKNFNKRSLIFKNGIFDKTKFLKEIKIDKKKEYFIKPKSGSGSKSISIWKGLKFDKTKFYLEEIYKGIELSIEVLSRNSNHTILAGSVRILVKKKSAAAIILFPEILKKKMIVDQVLKKLKIINVKNGISHIECILTPNGKIEFFDINLRCGGFGISDYLVSKSLKLNLYKIDFEILTNKFKQKLRYDLKKYGFLFYFSDQNYHFNKEINVFKKKYSYMKFKNVKNSMNKEIDGSRTALMYGHFNSKTKLFYFLKKSLKSKTYKKLTDTYKLINSLN